MVFADNGMGRRLYLFCVMISFALALSAQADDAAHSQGKGALRPNFGKVVPPEVVQLENERAEAGALTVTVGNSKGHYVLTCNLQASGCITPKPARNYLLFDKSTYWKMPGAKDFITLQFVQNWTVTYKDIENIGLVPEDSGGPEELGMYMLRSWNMNRR
jgi:hypothetical protein